MKYKHLYLIVLIPILFSSCIGMKELKLLQPNELTVLNDKALIAENYEPYKLQIDDNIRIEIETLDKEAQMLFGTNVNVGPGGGSSGGSGGIGDPYYMSGINIDRYGYINVVGLGRIKIAGLTLDEANVQIQKELDKIYLPGKSICRTFLPGVTFIIMGEVSSPGQKTINKDKATWLDVLAASGDFTKLAQRDKIRVFRKYPDGIKMTQVNMLDENIINSPYFYIHPNDYIIVDARKEKVSGVGGNTTLADITQILSLSISAITMYFFFRSL